MKKTVISSLLFLIIISASSQTLVDINKIWNVVSHITTYSNTRSYKFQGDSIINDTTYKILMATADPAKENWYVDELFREDETGKVFQRDYLGLEENLLYDFSLEEGDTFEGVYNYGCPITLTVLNVDSVSLNNGEKRKRIEFGEYNPDVWIEGIGSLNGLLNPGYQQCITVSFHLLCYKEDGLLLYDSPSYTECYVNSTNIEDGENQFSMTAKPNPFSDNIRINFNYTIPNIYEVRLMNIQGLVVYTKKTNSGEVAIPAATLQSGLYFIQLFENGQLVAKNKLVKH